MGRLHDTIGAALRGITLNIDLTDYCCLRCPSCAVGAIGGRAPSRMEIETFQNVLDHLESQTKVRNIQMYVYSDALLHPQAHLFFGEAYRRGIPSQSSTMLQTLKADLPSVIEARPSEFRISFAGWHLERHQVGGTVETFMKNLKWVSKLPRYPETKWTMFFHVYRDTLSELEDARKLAEDHGLTFVALPAIFMPMERIVEGYSEQDKETISGLLETPEAAISRMKQTNWCQLWLKQITLDAKCNVYLCELIYEKRFILGNFFEHDLRWFQDKMINHSFCTKCIAKGGHVYQQCFSNPIWSDRPVERANQKRKYTWKVKP